MNWIWYCIEIGVNLVEFGLYLFLINSKFRNKTKNVIPFLLALLVGTAGISYIGLAQITWFPEYIFEPIVIFLYALTTREGKWSLKLFWTATGMTLIIVTAIMGISVGQLIPGVTIEMIALRQSAIRFQLLVFCKLLQTIIFFILAKRKGSARLVSTFIIVLLVLVPITSMLTAILLVEYGVAYAPSSEGQFFMIGASMCVLIMNLMVFALYEILSKQAENNLHMQAKLQKYDMQARHNEEIKGLYDEMRGWRHDYHNHLQVIHGYLQLKMYKKLETYLRQIEQNISTIEETPVNSGNPLVDAIVSSKIFLARNQGIQVSANICVPADLDINDTDLCVLLGNLLDNATEACQRISDPQVKRFIEIEIRLVKGHLHITINNATNGHVKIRDSRFLSDKNGRYHGIGMRHIDEITEKYGGYLTRRHENRVFETNIMLPIKKELEFGLQTADTV